ncbi:MAG: HisA/HisF-related TIM barrel protein, partial [Acidimicrobiia bacterium]
MAFELYPAIDLRGGRCVRLLQGDFGRETVYGDDPVAQARAFVAGGARWLHVVDLDAARTGTPANRDVVAAIAAAVDVPVQAGGGVRDDAAADALLAAGVRRVVVGTAALDDPDWVRRLAARHPGRVAVGLDARGREVAVRGWTEGSGQDLVEVARRFDDAGVAALVVTEIGRDGTLAGPDL